MYRVYYLVIFNRVEQEAVAKSILGEQGEEE